MEVHPLLGQLDKLLAEEGELVGRGPLALPHQGISPGMRDGSAHVLRCLKVWFELPTDVFHTATANIDSFLAKMKVNPHQISKYFDIIYFNINILRCKQKKSEHVSVCSGAAETSFVYSRRSLSSGL